MNREDLRNKIQEILILSQYEHWVDTRDVTEGQLNTRNQRAIGYYLGIRPTPEELGRRIVVNTFNTLIKTQTARIMKEVEKLSPRGA